MRRALSLTALAAASLLIVAPAYARGVVVEVDYIDVSQAPVFSVYIDYLNEAGRPIRGLEPKDLSLLIDGERWDDPLQVIPRR